MDQLFQFAFFCSLQHLPRIIFFPCIQADCRQSSIAFPCSAVDRNVMVFFKNIPRTAVSKDVLCRCMPADYNDIIEIWNFVINPRPYQIIYRIFFQTFCFRKMIQSGMHQPVLLPINNFFSVWAERFHILYYLVPFFLRQFVRMLNQLG